MRYRIALCGFSEFEYRAMDFSFRHPTGFRESAYDVVDALSDADFAVVDADSQPAVKGVLLSGRVGQSVFVGTSAPDGAAWHLMRPIDPTRILRTLDTLTARAGAGAAPHEARRGPPPDSEFPTLDDVVDLPTTPGTLEDLAPLPAVSVPPAAAPDRSSVHAAAKAAARAAARRARHLSERAGAPALEPLRDVLVFDADAPANDALCALLARFGFSAHPVASMAQMGAQLAARPYAAIFLDIVLDDAGVALLRCIRDLPVPLQHPEPALLMVAAHIDPADRVTAALAGLPEPLIKPLGRGDVARALEARGVVLPADARRL